MLCNYVLAQKAVIWREQLKYRVRFQQRMELNNSGHDYLSFQLLPFLLRQPIVE
jgi:hypothetical protein